jgi:hypothetical protein
MLLALGYGQLLVENGGIRRDAWDRNFGDLTQELQLGDYVASSVVLARRSGAGITNAAAGINRTSARRFGTRPDTADIMRSARTIVVRSMTIYLEPQQLESELRQRPEFKSLGLAIVKDEQMADLRSEINRAEFSFNYAYTVTNPPTSIVIASGSVTAWNGEFAAPLIAEEILKEINRAH